MQQTSTESVANQRLVERESEPGPPETEYDSKMVMLRAERGDNIQVVDVVNRLGQPRDIPSKTEVVKVCTDYACSKNWGVVTCNPVPNISIKPVC